jgi:hypothetical protein
MAVIMGGCVTPGGVMRKTQTSLTYRGDKMRERYQVLKKIFWGQKSPVRLLYEHGWGTTISPWDEVSYIGICLGETIKIFGSPYIKKISQGKKWTIG